MRKQHLCIRVLLLTAIVCATGQTQAQVIRQLTDVRASLIARPRVVDGGHIVFFASTADPVGSNPKHRWQLFRWRLSTGTIDPVPNLPLGTLSTSLGPGISDDGNLLAFASSEDLTGANPDRSAELFLMNADGSGLVQLTQGSGDGSIGRIEMSGTGQRIVFDADFDYGGLNPGGIRQVFRIDADGSNLIRLSELSTGGYLASIDDGGTRVVYTDYTTGLVQAILANGTLRRQLTSWSAASMMISGNGATVIILGTGTLPNNGAGWCNGGTQVGAVNWDGSAPKKLSGLCLGNSAPGSVSFAEVTDDGQTIFYVGSSLSSRIYSVRRDASQETKLGFGSAWAGAACSRIGVAGGGSQIAMTCEGGDMVGANPDRSLELFYETSTGSGLAQLTSSLPWGDSFEPQLSLDSGHAVFLSDANLLGEAPDPGLEVYRTTVAGGAIQRLTNLDGATPREPVVISADGDRVIFPGRTDSTGSHRLYAVDVPAGSVTAITGTSSDFYNVDLDDDGSDVVAVNAFASSAMSRMAFDGTGVTPLGQGVSPRIDGAGQHVVSSWSGQIRQVNIDGSGTQVLATGLTPDISRDGSLVVFDSTANPLGTNGDGNREIFSYDVPSATLRQLTSTTGDVGHRSPSISGNGRFVYVSRTDASGNPRKLIRIDMLTLGEEPVTPTGCVQAVSQRPVATDHTGIRAVFYSTSDCSGDNPDGNQEIFLVDFGVVSVNFGAGEPAPLEWQAATGISSYDLIRGDVASLVNDAGTTDLGAVTCLQDQLAVDTTASTVDPAEPAPGQTFFYIVRSQPGGDYGVSSSGTPRVPASGDCPID